MAFVERPEENPRPDCCRKLAGSNLFLQIAGWWLWGCLSCWRYSLYRRSWTSASPKRCLQMRLRQSQLSTLFPLGATIGVFYV